jgi:hypothetical protein
MSLRGFPAVAFTTTLLVCCWQERVSERVSRQLVVAENSLAAGGKLVLLDQSCTITVTPAKPEGHADVPCLAALAKDSTVDYSKRRMKQGCMPGKIYWTYAGECRLGDLAVDTSGDCSLR